jgi:glutathione S-transferase
MQPTVSAFRWVPPFAQGLVRDLRVRWAFHEAGRDYSELLIGPEDQGSDAYRALQPFGQVPAYRDADVELFESGAIVLHIAEICGKLLPTEFRARSRAKTWMFAALNTVEPPIVFLNQLQQINDEKSDGVRAATTAAVTRRLDALTSWIGERPYLEETFTAGDLLMVSVLRILRSTSIMDDYPSLSAYQQRCEERPAFERALADQLHAFRTHEPAMTGR